MAISSTSPRRPMNTHQLRGKRMRAGLTASLVARRAKIDPSRLCRIEKGYVFASADELQRIAQAITELIAAQSEMKAVAERLGWPL